MYSQVLSRLTLQIKAVIVLLMTVLISFISESCLCFSHFPVFVLAL